MFKEFVDLTYPLHDGMLTYTAHWHPRTEVTQMGRIGVEGRETRRIVIGTHTGTHVDAPLHFIGGGASVDRLPLDVLVGPVTIVDATKFEQNRAITPEDLKELPLSERVIFRFGWGRRWGSIEFYRDHPYFSEDAACYLIEQGVRLVGLDTPSPDASGIGRPRRPDEPDSPVHKILLSEGVVLVEYLANLDTVESLAGWTLLALPLHLRGGDGAPARVLLAR